MMDVLDGSHLLSSRQRGSGFGSKRALGRKSKAEPESDALLKRVKKDNKRLLKELEDAEANAKELKELSQENELLRIELEKLKDELVSNDDIEKVKRAIKEEKTAIAVIQLEKENTSMEILSFQKQKSRKSRKSN